MSTGPKVVCQNPSCFNGAICSERRVCPTWSPFFRKGAYQAPWLLPLLLFLPCCPALGHSMHRKLLREMADCSTSRAAKTSAHHVYHSHADLDTIHAFTRAGSAAGQSRATSPRKAYPVSSCG